MKEKSQGLSQSPDYDATGKHIVDELLSEGESVDSDIKRRRWKTTLRQDERKGAEASSASAPSSSKPRMGETVPVPPRRRMPVLQQPAAASTHAAPVAAPKQAQEIKKKPEVPLGYVNFDNRIRENGSCEVIVPPECAKNFRRDVYVGIRDREQKVEFLGRIIAGPFHIPNDPTKEQKTAPAATEGSVLDPDQRAPYSVYGRIEILGQLVKGANVVPTPTRPRPYSEIYVFPDHRLQQFLRLNGDFYLGHLAGHTTVSVHGNSNDKNFLPRNVGIFGTVGSGKSNTAQVIAEQAAEAGWAVVLIDVEGEYVCMDQPNDDPNLIRLLMGTHRLEPTGMQDFRVYVPSSGQSEAVAPHPFKVPISSLYPEVVADILEFSEAQARVFAMVTEQAERFFSAEPAGSSSKPYRPYDLQQLLDGLMVNQTVNGPSVRLLPMADSHDVSTAGVLRSKLHHLERSQMLDSRATADIPELPVHELLVGGRLSVLDVSGTDDRSRNIAIAYVLQELFRRVIETPRGERMPTGGPRPPLLVMIEEVHTFVSRAAAPKMRAVLDSMQVISRRGRKRWMSLALVSQQPNHVPDEIFELANTRFILQIKSPNNLDPVKRTTAGIDEALWENVSAMGPGQSLLTGSAFKKPLFIKVRPARSRRLLVS